MRVHELAKRLGMTSKDMLAKLKERHIEAKSHMSCLDEDVVKLFMEERAASRAPEVPGRGRPRAHPAKKEIKPPPSAPQRTTGMSVKTPETSPGAAMEEPSEAEVQAPAKDLRPLEVEVPISLKDLAFKMQEKPSVLIKLLMEKFKLFANINQSLTEEIIVQILAHYGYALNKPASMEEMLAKSLDEVDESQLEPRSPIVTFMGHVDHGKTSLLDAVRRSKVVDSEHGGITQHIGAYEVKLPKGQITFLDTPGHEAFTAMRARGAHITDVVILVVAADDGIMPQTVEAYDHAKAAGVPVVVAINKIDKPSADLDKVKRQLNELGLVAEHWGGKTITVGVSAKTGEGIDNLLDMILLEAEMLELKAVYEKEATGVVVEAKLSKGRGPVATVLVQNGTLKTGNFLVIGAQSGRIRGMFNDHRQAVTEAKPSTPVEIIGLSGVPQAGERFYVISDEKRAKSIISQRQQEMRRQRLEPRFRKVHLEDLYKQIQEGKVKELNMILKADTQGSVEAIQESLLRLGTSEVKVTIIHKGAGMINTSDVVLATASNAIIIGFHVEPDDLAKEMAQKEEIDIRTYRVIYEIINDIKAALEGMLAPKIKKTFLGRAEVRRVFKLSKSGIVAGSFVRKGKISRGAHVVVVRNGEVVFEGKVAALKRFKDDVREVQEGFECGISLENFQAVEEGDFIDAFELQKIARKLS